MESPSATISVFYDGLCPLCSKEMDHYKKQKGSERLLFIDITEAHFDAKKEGLDPYKVHQVMHVKTSEGLVMTGVDAFIAIWDFLPQYNWVSKWAQKSFIRPFLNVGYQVFASIRPYLPRKTRDCEISPYCPSRRKQ